MAKKKINTSSGLSGTSTILTGNTGNNITGTSNTNIVYGNGYTSWGTTATIQAQKTTYVILGEEYETTGYPDPTLGMTIATLNVLGKPYWLELKKQQFSFGYDIDAFIEKRIIVLDRDKKIDDLLK